MHYDDDFIVWSAFLDFDFKNLSFELQYRLQLSSLLYQNCDIDMKNRLTFQISKPSWWPVDRLSWNIVNLLGKLFIKSIISTCKMSDSFILLLLLPNHFAISIQFIASSIQFFYLDIIVCSLYGRCLYCSNLSSFSLVCLVCSSQRSKMLFLFLLFDFLRRYLRQKEEDNLNKRTDFNKSIKIK